MNRVRVRFAPSPTGPLHMGGVRTALYNYLFARKNGGDFLLRIEDTDRARFVSGADDYIRESLEWCGITPDEGAGFGGTMGPYKQSERTAIYAEHIVRLLACGEAYEAFDTPEELTEKRTQAESRGETWQYDASTRLSMRNSLSCSAEEVAKLKASGAAVIVRFQTPSEAQDIVFTDAIRDTVRISSTVMDDKVLMKADGLPTYHFANVVDDHLMEISHVIRGEEWLPSTPLHVMLYRAFGWEMPVFAHLPLILKPTGNGKLSKRDGDAGGFPIFPLQWTDPVSGKPSLSYRESGYSPEAFLNMLLFLGWNPGTEQEVYGLEEAAEAFSLERVVKAGARFNPDKAKWFNAQHLRSQSEEVLATDLAKLVKEVPKGPNWNEGQCLAVVRMMIERVTFLPEVLEAEWLFKRPEAFDAKLVRKKWKEQTGDVLLRLLDRLEGLETYEEAAIEGAFKAYLEEEELGFGAVLLPFRIALTGTGGGPSMFALAAFLGANEVRGRVQDALVRADTMKSEAL